MKQNAAAAAHSALIGINLETKNLYLDLNVVNGLNAKIGMQGYNDAFKGIIFDADMAGILLAHNYDNAGVTAGFFRFSDRNTSTIGKNTHDMFSLDGRYSISKEQKSALRTTTSLTIVLMVPQPNTILRIYPLVKRRWHPDLRHNNYYDDYNARPE